MSELSDARARIAESGVIDLHVDPFIWTRVCGYDVTRSHRSRRPPYFGGHVDLPRLREAGVTGAFWSITTQPFRGRRARDARWRRNAAQLLDSLGPDAGVRWVTRAADYAAARERGQLALMLAIQGGSCLEGTALEAELPPELLRVTLTHMTASRLGSASTPFGGGGGLTPLGRDWVRRLDAARILVDLAHANEQTFWDVVRVGGGAPPRIASHTGASGVRPLWRNLSDEQIRAIAESGGCVGVIFHSPYLRPGFRSAGIADVVDHIAHILDVAGEDTPAIGSDWDGAIRPAHGLEEPAGLAHLVAAMSRRGFPDAVIEKVLAGNALRVLGALRGVS